MRDVVSMLYYWNYLDSESGKQGRAYSKQLKKVVEFEGNLTQSLSKEQQARFKEYIDACAELTDMDCRNAFSKGYRLGMRLMIAATEEEASD